jgi:drug/metabolite transporter (DMT)-like permease
MNAKAKSNLMLVVTALIWGSAFVAQSVGMDYLGPFTFNSVRCFLGGLILLPVIKLFDMQKKNDTKRKNPRTLLVGGICCGTALAVASSLQQLGIVYTTAGKAGFITALYILIVPVMGLLLKKKVGKKTWIGVALAVIGMYFLCITDGFSISGGDFLVFLCAIIFAVHIMVIDHFSPRVDGVKMSCIQFFVCGILCAIPMLLFERPDPAQILAAWMPLCYAGFLSCGVAYTLQIVAQKNTNPTVASLLMSLESVFAVLTGWIILGERLTPREFAGCALMFAAIILAQLPEKKKEQAL